ncbi:MAG: hypothetical protein CMN31_26445 [Sandaracinus sp.]|nr:hypothetical protein [Sandaracinus sp.]
MRRAPEGVRRERGALTGGSAKRYPLGPVGRDARGPTRAGSPEAPVTGRRVHERYDCELPVTLVHGEEETPGKATNISLGGMYVVTPLELAYGTPVKVRFRVPALKEDALVECTVRWAKDDGIGAQFGSLRAIEVWALNQYFKGLEPSPVPE